MRELPDWLGTRAATNPDHVALVAQDREWTFAELDAQADTTARKLAFLGVREGDRVATLLDGGRDAAVLPHATLRLGAVLVPLNTRLTTGELDWQIGDIKPRIVIRREGMLDGVEEKALRLRRVHPLDAVVAVIYTSGTTGRPKGAMLTFGNFWWSAIGSALNLGVRPDDRWLACLPLFHVGGLSILFRSAIYGTTAVVHDRFDAKAVNRSIDEREVSIVSLVSVMLERMLDARPDKPYPPTLRCVLLGGGSASRSLLERCASLQVPVVQTYGLTETCSQIATISPADAIRKLGSSGKAIYPNELRISDTGEIIVRGPVVMAGYANRPRETAAVLRNGWLHTGDTGTMDPDGFLFVLDRRDDLIVTGGENVYPAEVEAVLASHPSVAEACVIGMADATWGQQVVAIVKLNESEPADADTLKAHCAAGLAGFKIPRQFHFVMNALPRTVSGKLKRSALREMLTGAERPSA